MLLELVVPAQADGKPSPRLFWPECCLRDFRRLGVVMSKRRLALDAFASRYRGLPCLKLARRSRCHPFHGVEPADGESLGLKLSVRDEVQSPRESRSKRW